jgi:uncharacterized protein (TIGR02147 family)
MQNEVKELILSKYQERRLRNAHYSLRAFAELLGISSGALTGIVQGKRKISKNMAERLAITLRLSQDEKEKFLSPFKRGSKTTKVVPTSRHSLQTFELIANWQYFALLSVLKIRNVKWTLSKIAEKLEISESECRNLLSNLTGLGIVEEKNGFFFRGRKPIEFGDEIPSWAIKASHAETLELARKSIYDVPFEKRHHSSMTLAINIKNLKKAEERIRQFQLDMAELLEAGIKS